MTQQTTMTKQTYDSARVDRITEPPRALEAQPTPAGRLEEDGEKTVSQ